MARHSFLFGMFVQRMGGGAWGVPPPNRSYEEERLQIQASRSNTLSKQRYRSRFGVQLPESGHRVDELNRRLRKILRESLALQGGDEADQQY